MFQSFGEGFTEIVSVVLDAFNTNILPVIQDAAARFQDFKDAYLQPLIDKFLEFGGKVADTVTVIWDNALKPFLEWAINTLAPKLGETIEGVSKYFTGLFETVSKVAEDILDALNGVLEFLQGVFTGDTEKALNGLKDVFKGVFNGIVQLVEDAVNGIVKGLNGISFDIDDWVPVIGGKHFGFDVQPVKLPRLAQGGFVRANTPQLAMIGDNRHQGEVVAPEGKLRELLDEAVKGRSGGTELLEIILLLRDMTGFLKTISQKGDGKITAAEIFQAVKDENEKYITQHGDSAFI